MKRAFITKRFFLVFVATLSIFFCAVCVLACGGKSDAHIHRYADFTYNDDATCGADGTETGKCSCGRTDTRIKVGSATGKHDYHEYICSVCNSIDPAAPDTEELLYSEVSDDGENMSYCVSGVGDKGKAFIKVPREFDGLPVIGIGDNAFFDSGAKCIVLPDTITTIGDGAFEYCRSLTSIDIPNSVTSIGGTAFAVCDKLQHVTIPNSVVSIGEDAFMGCDALQYNEYQNGFYLGNSQNPHHALIGYKDNTVGSYVVNNNTKIVADGVFGTCNGLSSIVIPNSVENIGRKAFLYCEKLRSVTIGGSVKCIPERAFSCCYVITSITIPKSVTSIEQEAFAGCTKLTGITIPSSVTIIASKVFDGCGKLTNVKFNGTKQQWAEVEKADDWNEGSTIDTITCSDGEITL